MQAAAVLIMFTLAAIAGGIEGYQTERKIPFAVGYGLTLGLFVALIMAGLLWMLGFLFNF